MQLSEEIIRYIDSHADEALALLLELAVIPAPSNHEEKRAEFCRGWLEKQGAQGVYIDEALNVIYPLGDTGTNPLVVYMAHSDVVFPDTTPLPLTVEADRICCPGIGDDSANVAALLLAAKYLAETGLQPTDTGVLMVVNAIFGGIPYLGFLLNMRLWIAYIAAAIVMLILRVRMMFFAWRGARFVLPVIGHKLDRLN